jgi:hypothetical protein
MPLASMSKVTSICGVPRGAGGRPTCGLGEIVSTSAHTRRLIRLMLLCLMLGCSLRFWSLCDTNKDEGHCWAASMQTAHAAATEK